MSVSLEDYGVLGRELGKLTRVPALKIPPRAPLGPSEVLMAGIPFDGIA